MRIHDEGTLASSDQTNIKWFVRHDDFGCVLRFLKMFIYPATRRSYETSHNVRSGVVR